jgi:hypothetical protein
MGRCGVVVDVLDANTLVLRLPHAVRAEVSHFLYFDNNTLLNLIFLRCFMHIKSKIVLNSNKHLHNIPSHSNAEHAVRRARGAWQSPVVARD